MKRVIGLIGMLIFGLSSLLFVASLFLVPTTPQGTIPALLSSVLFFALSAYVFFAKSTEIPILEEQRRETDELFRTLRREHSLTVVALSVVLIAVYVVLFSVGAISLSPTVAQLYKVGAGFGESTAHGQAWRLFTQIFLHADLWHLISNILGLWAAGRLLEFVAGRKNLISVFLAGGLLASVTSSVYNPAVVSVGASGAIFALYGALFSSYFFNSKMHDLKIPKSMWWLTAIQVLNSIWYGFQNVGIDNAAHVGGLVGGFVVMTVWYKLSARNSVYAPKAFVGAAGVAFVFAIAVMPMLIKNSGTNPVAAFEKHDAVSVAIKNVVTAEAELGSRTAGLNPDNMAEFVSWVQKTHIPKYEKAIAELNSISNAGLNEKVIKLKEAVSSTAGICNATFRRMSGLDRAPASESALEAEQFEKACTEALKDREAMFKNLSK